MNRGRMIRERLRSHRLSAPARTITDAAAHMLAVQAQEYWGGRWALAVRTAGSPTLTDVDAAFDRGEIVRAWTQRGTIHAVPARDVGWMLSVTAARQLRSAAPRHRDLGLDDDDFRRSERAIRAALAGGGRLTRKEFAEVIGSAGVDPAGQRGIHVLQTLALRAVIVSGPVVARAGRPSREQYVVLFEEWIRDPRQPADPMAELFARFVASHAPATARDFAWWTGLPLGVSRAAADAASDRIVATGDGADPVYLPAAGSPRRSPRAARVLALPPFEEYYLPYADRTTACAPAFIEVVGPSKNGIVRPVLVADGEIIGVWRPSLAVGHRAADPVHELFAPGAATDAEISAALARYRAFITG